MAWETGYQKHGDYTPARRGGYSRRNRLREFQKDPGVDGLTIKRDRLVDGMPLTLDEPDIANRRRVLLAMQFGQQTVTAICRWTRLSRAVVSAIVDELEARQRAEQREAAA